jgi:peptide/nickel transport system substrate-binding protein
MTSTPRRRRLQWFAAAAAALLALALAGCGSSGKSGGSSTSATNSSSTNSSSTPAGGSPQRGGNLVIDTATPSQDFDVNTTSDNESIWPLDEVGEELYVNGKSGKSLTPWLATGYTLSPDKVTWTFQLRHGVHFSTGQLMTSKDVVWSITQSLNPKSTWSFIDSPIKKVVADGPYRVKITTKQPWAPLLADLALFANAIFPDHYLGESRAKFFQHPIGTGPFVFDKWVKGQYLKLTRNPHYWQAGKPYLDSITYQAVSDANTRVVQLKGGQAQIIEQAPYALLSSLQGSGYKLGLFPSTRIDYVTMNELQAPFKNLDVRLAIAHALNRGAIMKSVFFGHGQVANSPLMPNVSYYSPVGLPNYDPALAKKELAASPYPHGGFSIDFIAGSGDPVQSPVSQIVASELKPLGINVKIRQLDPSEVTAQEQSFHFGMRETYWTMDIIDPDEYVSFVLCGSCGSFANWTHFKNAQIDSLTGQAERTFSSSKRAAIYQQIQKLAGQQSPIVWLGYSPYSYVYNSSVHNYYVYPEGNTHFEDVWLSK